MTQYVYAFKEGSREQRELLGGKGANLAEMFNLGLPVPNGFIIATTACLKYFEDNKTIEPFIIKQIEQKLTELEGATNLKFGDPHNPLLLSVRSGAQVSMPGMMDTVLNIGLNDKVVAGMIATTNDEWFVYDLYRRLILMYADVVLGLERKQFETIITEIKTSKGFTSDLELESIDLRKIITSYLELIKELTGKEFPQDPKVQLIECIKAVFKSWFNERAVNYRKLNQISDYIGTAVTVQMMVYGNLNQDSLTGVLFSRNPATGANQLYGEYLVKAQGEDIVAGVRTPLNIETLKDSNLKLYLELNYYAKQLERHYLDMQDIEWTVMDKMLYIMQTRSGKRTAPAALKIAVALVKEGLITREQALMLVEPKQLEHLLHPTFNLEELKEVTPIAQGLAASPGGACGKIYFNSTDLLTAYQKGERNLILVRFETSPEDIMGMNYATGILTIQGGMTSHAAVVARGMGKCCVSGCTDLIIKETEKTLTTKTGIVFNEGSLLALDGSSGFVYGTKLELITPTLTNDFKEFFSYTNDIKTLKVRANADTVTEITEALNFNITGIGLCRTEHMFFGEEKIMLFREMILAETKAEREVALTKLEVIQEQDFVNILEVLAGKPLTVRYLDPPLHEFLPKTEVEIKTVADTLKIDLNVIKSRIEALKEYNPMLGHRGCRLAITYPEIMQMQTRAIIKAALKVLKQEIPVALELMIPLINDRAELKYLKEIIITEINTLLKEEPITLNYKLGTMIEVPRAALLASEISKEVDFFSFGTNDLTQMTYGFSRDDAEKFLPTYYQKGIYKFDPFVKLDQYGVGSLLNIAIVQGRNSNPNLEVGLCGEQGGDPQSIEFLQKLNVDYVSCSPFRVPIARLAAVQAQLRNPR